MHEGNTWVILFTNKIKDAHAHANAHAGTHAREDAHARAHADAHARTHTHIHTHTCTYIHTHCDTREHSESVHRSPLLGPRYLGYMQLPTLAGAERRQRAVGWC
eukprot:5832750-Amphidinium_carterae.1